MRVTTTVLFALTVCNYSIVSISCSRQEPQSSPGRDISGLSRDHSAATFAKYRQYDRHDEDDGDDNGRPFPQASGGSSGATHRTSHASSSSASLTAGSLPRIRRDLLVRSSRMKRSDWDDSVMSWMKRFDVRKLSPADGSSEKVADESHVIGAPAVGVRTNERAIPTGLANKRSFDTDMAWLKRSGHLKNWDLDQFVRRPDVRSWDESDMSWMKRGSEHDSSLPEAVNAADDKSAVSSDDESNGGKRKWKSDVAWIKK